MAFDTASLTGDQVMQASGIEYATSTYGGMGKAVCQVDGEPATYPSSCWTSTSPYWAMFVSRGGDAWSTSARGISTETFADGDALGWHYIPVNGGAPPPSPAGVCAAAEAPTPQPIAPATAAPPSAAAPTPAAAPPSTAPAAPSPPSAPRTASIGVTSTPATASASEARSAHPAARTAGLDAGLLAASAVAGVLGGLLLLQLFAARLRP